MKSSSRDKYSPIFGILFSILPVVYLQILSLVSEKPFDWRSFLSQWIFTACILLSAKLVGEKSNGAISKKVFVIRSIFIVFGIISALVYIVYQTTLSAFIIILTIFASLIVITHSYSLLLGKTSRFILYIIFAWFVGFITITLAQIETRFSEEEYFMVFQTLEISLYWCFLLITYKLWMKWTEFNNHIQIPLTRLNILTITLIIISFTYWAIREYQQSFFPPSAPGFNLISESNPFLCSKIEPGNQIFDGKDLFYRLNKLIEANPEKHSPEYGHLAIVNNDPALASLFKENLLLEAQQQLFTTPAHSVKSSQYEAALRVYYYSKVQSKFPNLFSEDEQTRITDWFAAINRRAQTVEWVDWLYAIALRKIPQGPYENQEIGAGLLSILEFTHLSDTNLTHKNQTYLDHNLRGWYARFRNTDDAIVYQPVWLRNALFQYYYSNQLDPSNLKKSFDWLLLQTLPDGSLPRYNHPAEATIADTAYWAAQWLRDKTHLWFSGKGIQYIEDHGRYLIAQPGAEESLLMTSQASVQGSCLMYGGSGLPNQIGPLAPDKIVYRDGWDQDSSYLLLNLRFTGWHRYKATNTVTLIYQAGKLLEDTPKTEFASWLPVGRSLLRDKRILREDLNGFLVSRSGMSKVLQFLTNYAGEWAQDPPYYASIERFETSPNLDISTSVIDEWRGYSHHRTVYFYHDGPIIILDKSSPSDVKTFWDPFSRSSGFVWHFHTTDTEFKKETTDELRILLRKENHPVEMVLIPLDQGKIRIGVDPRDNEEIEVLYQSQGDRMLNMATVFLPDQWVNASINISGGVQQELLISNQQEQLVIPLP